MKSAASGSFGLLFAALRVAAIARSTTARLRSYSTWSAGLMLFLFDLIVESSFAIVCRYERSPGSSFTGAGADFGATFGVYLTVRKVELFDDRTGAAALIGCVLS